MGCSLELFEIISRINRLRISWTRSPREPINPILRQYRIDLGEKLHNLVQHVGSEEDNYATPWERNRALATADIYRIAAILYLQRACPIDGDDSTRDPYVVAAFSALETLKVPSSPWPLFVVACESQSEEQRMRILQMLDRMDSTRNIGNILVLRNIIEQFWKQNDLRGLGCSSRQLNWSHFGRSDIPVPWFV